MTKQEETELREKFTLLQHRIKHNNPPMDLDAWYRFEKIRIKLYFKNI